MLLSNSLGGVILFCVYFLNLRKMFCWNMIILSSFPHAYDLTGLTLMSIANGFKKLYPQNYESWRERGENDVSRQRYINIFIVLPNKDNW